MREAGVNLVTLGVFAWAKMEPAPGHYDFNWLDQVMDLLNAHGVRVDLATPTAAPPAWLVRMKPEILPVTAEGVTPYGTAPGGIIALTARLTVIRQLTSSGAWHSTFEAIRRWLYGTWTTNTPATLRNAFAISQ